MTTRKGVVKRMRRVSHISTRSPWQIPLLAKTTEDRHLITGEVLWATMDWAIRLPKWLEERFPTPRFEMHITWEPRGEKRCQ